MALPERPVVAVVGDGSSLYGIQGALERRALRRRRPVRDPRRTAATRSWTASPSGTEATRRGPAFGEIEIAAVARAFGCEARRIETHDELVAALDEVLPTLASRQTPLLLDVVIAPTAHFAP